jgi:hypothetical protein
LLLGHGSGFVFQMTGGGVTIVHAFSLPMPLTRSPA